MSEHSKLKGYMMEELGRIDSYVETHIPSYQNTIIAASIKISFFNTTVCGICTTPTISRA